MNEAKKGKNINTKLIVQTKNGQYSDNGKNRSILTVGWNGENKKSAVAIGINPSKANDSRSDKTLTTLARFLNYYGYSEFQMLNIFESYSTNQNGICKGTVTDFSCYNDIFDKVDSIFIVWGVSNSYKEEKETILKFLRKYKEKVFCIRNDNGSYPLHPSRMNYKNEIAKYIFNEIS